MMWLSDVEKSLMTHLAVSIEYRHVTGRRTDILQQHRLCYAYHPAVKMHIICY